MSLPRFVGAVFALTVASPFLRADKHVAIIAQANPDYVRARLDENGRPRTETYVVMQGRFFEGMIRDASIDRMDFRDLVGRLAPELARQRYLPASGPDTADLMLVVHWGTTIPQIGLREMTANPTQELDHDKQLYDMLQRAAGPGESIETATGGGTAPGLGAEYQPRFGHDNETSAGFSRLEEVTHEASQQLRRSDNAALLGYSDALHREGKRIWGSEDERMMRHDLNAERYFIIIRAYELKNRTPGLSRKKPVWTMHLNIGSPGNNFKTALARMGEGVAHYAGQGTGSLTTLRAGKAPIGTVKLGDLIILGEAKGR